MIHYLCPKCPDTGTPVPWNHVRDDMRQDVEIRWCEECGFDHGHYVTDACPHVHPLCLYWLITTYTGPHLMIQVCRR